MEQGALANLAFFITIFFFAIYALLDGFDLGIGMLLPFAKDTEKADRLQNLIGPFWDGNEVWLVIGAGALFAAFPAAYALLLSSFYLPLMGAIAAYIVRAISIEFSYHDRANIRLWRVLIGLSSFGATVAGLFAVGMLVYGLPFSAPGVINTASFSIPLFAIFFAVTGTLAVLWHGSMYAHTKNESDPHSTSTKTIWIAMLILSAITALTGYLTLPHQQILKPAVLIGSGLFVAQLIAGQLFIARKQIPFYCSCAGIAGLWLAIGAVLFPYVVPAHNNPVWGLSIINAAGQLKTLKIFVGAAIIITPFIIAYTWFIYHIFRKPAPQQPIVPENPMEQLVKCKACGFIMNKAHLLDKCPACGVAAKMFEDYAEKIAPMRKFILSLDIHPVLAHFPQAFAFTLLATSIVAFFARGQFLISVNGTITVLGVALPLVVAGAFFAGILDGTIRFRKVTTPLLIRKMVFGALFFTVACGVCAIILLHPFAPNTTLCAIALLSALSLGCATVLGLIGTSLLNAKFPG